MLALVLAHARSAFLGAGVTGPVTGETHDGPAHAQSLKRRAGRAKGNNKKRAKRASSTTAGYMDQHRGVYRDQHGKSTVVSGTSRTCVFDSMFMMLVAAGALPPDAPRSFLPNTPDASVVGVISVLVEFKLTIRSTVSISYSASRVLATKNGFFLIFLYIVYKEADKEADEHAIFYNADARCLLDNDRFAKVKHVDDGDARRSRAFAVFNSFCPSALRVEVRNVYQLVVL